MVVGCWLLVVGWSCSGKTFTKLSISAEFLGVHVLRQTLRPLSDHAPCKMRVSLESRYGMRVAFFCWSAVITRPRVSSDWLMFLRSRSIEVSPPPAL